LSFKSKKSSDIEHKNVNNMTMSLRFGIVNEQCPDSHLFVLLHHIQGDSLHSNMEE